MKKKDNLLTFHKRRSFSLALHNSVQKQGLPTHFISKGITLKIIATYFQSNKNTCTDKHMCMQRALHYSRRKEFLTWWWWWWCSRRGHSWTWNCSETWNISFNSQSERYVITIINNQLTIFSWWKQLLRITIIPLISEFYPMVKSL